MNPIELTVEIMKAVNNEPHCAAELADNRPIEHWQTHCINCGVHMTKHHIRDDCPPQNYELKEQS